MDFVDRSGVAIPESSGAAPWRNGRRRRLKISRPQGRAGSSPAGATGRLVPANALKPTLSPAERLRLFDAATQRQRERERECHRAPAEGGRGWTREELYERGSSR